jgi:hypothetical protein
MYITYNRKHMLLLWIILTPSRPKEVLIPENPLKYQNICRFLRRLIACRLIVSAVPLRYLFDLVVWTVIIP